jgi:outer membrane murein-binding lipoprotein Lpp
MLGTTVLGRLYSEGIASMPENSFARWSGAAVAVLTSLLLGAVLWGNFSARLEAVERAVSDHRLQPSHGASGERITRIETQLISLNTTLEKLDRSVDGLRSELAADRKAEKAKGN